MGGNPRDLGRAQRRKHQRRIGTGEERRRTRGLGHTLLGLNGMGERNVDPADFAVNGHAKRLERLLGRAVDVVSVASIRNPYFRERVMSTREPLYAA